MKKKISILGGGIAGLTSAYELTSETNWQEKYDITIYQMGWRCGGKATTGIGKNGRIEEVGVHIFQGWYHNAFRMVKEVYKEIEEQNLAPDSPLKSWRDAFIPNPYTFNTEYNEKSKSWDNWTMVFPNNSYTPGTEIEMDFLTLLKEGLGILLETLLRSPYQTDTNGKRKLRSKIIQKLFFNVHIPESDVEDTKERTRYPFIDNILKRIVKGAESGIIKLTKYGRGSSKSIFIKSCMKLFRGMKKTIQVWSSRCSSNRNGLRRVLMMMELAMVCIEGVYADVYNPKSNTYDWDAINPYDFREWLLKHGASKALLEFSIVRFIYYGTFGNMYGGNGSIEQGKIGADIGLKMITKIPSYKGCFVWYLTAGTGGSFLAPLTLVLKNRGVTFKYFHQVREVAYSDTDDIQRIEMDVQLDLKNDISEYNPFVIQKGIHQWTSEPDWSQLNTEQAKLAQEQGVDLESSFSQWAPVSSNTLLKGKDFDIVILATSIQPIKQIAKDIISKNERWSNMVHHIATTPTLNVQFWIKKNDKELGFDNGKWGIEEGQYPNTVIYENYLYSWTSMSYLEKVEHWKNQHPKQISYWCGVWPENLSNPKNLNTESTKHTTQDLKNHTSMWMNDHMKWFWPNAMKDGTFDFDLLCSDKNTPAEKFDDQFFQINDDPARQYVLGRPGSNKYRIKSDDTGYQNLFFAGDWTDFGLNVGYMEGTVQSGIHCANSIKRRFYNDILLERKLLG